MRQRAWLEQLLQDLGYGLRLVRRDPGLSLGIVTILAVALGVTTAVWSFADKSLLRPLPFEDAGRLVWLRGSDTRRGFERLPISYRDFHDWRERSRRFDDLAAWRHEARVRSDGALPEHVRGRRRHRQPLRAARRDRATGRPAPFGRGRRTELRVLERPLRRRSTGHRLQSPARRQDLHHHRRPARALRVSAVPRRVPPRGVGLARPGHRFRGAGRPRRSQPCGRSDGWRRAPISTGPGGDGRHRTGSGARVPGHEPGRRRQHGTARRSLGRSAPGGAAGRAARSGAGPARGLQQRGRPARRPRRATAARVHGTVGPRGGPPCDWRDSSRPRSDSSSPPAPAPVSFWRTLPCRCWSGISRREART